MSWQIRSHMSSRAYSLIVRPHAAQLKKTCSGKNDLGLSYGLSILPLPLPNPLSSSFLPYPLTLFSVIGLQSFDRETLPAFRFPYLRTWMDIHGFILLSSSESHGPALPESSPMIVQRELPACVQDREKKCSFPSVLRPRCLGRQSRLECSEDHTSRSHSIVSSRAILQGSSMSFSTTEIFKPFASYSQSNVYSPAFSDPPSPMSTTSDIDETDMITSSTTSLTELVQEQPVKPEIRHFVNKMPAFPTIYHEALQPLSPLTTLPVPSRVMPSSSTRSQKIDEALQAEFVQKCLRVNDVPALEDFLRLHSEHLNLNAYDEYGSTPLHMACLEGNLPLVKVLIQFGANPHLTNRDGFSLAHLASFSYNSQLLTYILGLKSSNWLFIIILICNATYSFSQ